MRAKEGAWKKNSKWTLSRNYLVLSQSVSQLGTCRVLHTTAHTYYNLTVYVKSSSLLAILAELLATLTLLLLIVYTDLSHGFRLIPL